MAAKKAPAKIAGTKQIAAWSAVPCFICSEMVNDGKQALRVQRIEYAKGKTKWYSWAHRGCWK
jgi:hypothetical protein